MKRISKKLQAQADLTIEFVGDSVTHGLNHCRPEETYVAKFAALFAKEFHRYAVYRYDGIMADEASPLKGFDGPTLVSLGEGQGKADIIKNGVGGNTVARAHKRIDDFTGVLANGKRPDVIFFMFGINDALQADPKKYVSPDAFKENYRNLLDDVHARNSEATLILMSATYNDQSVSAHCARIEELAAERGLPYIDLHALWTSHFDPDADNFGQGEWLAGGTDACHPTPVGAECTAAYIVEEFLKLLTVS